VRPELPTGTVTFLFTDIEGSTRLLHALGPDAYADALARHRSALRQAFAAHNGVEVDTQGDAFFVAFPTAAGAAAAAEAGHATLASGPINVRMGLHTGTPTLTAEGYVGVDVHRAARIAALAHGGQTVLSEATAALLDGVSLAGVGRHRIKDFDAPVQLLQLGRVPFPPLRTSGAVDLPTPATPFLGRERELYAAVALVLERDPRLLTVLGPGGTGKTRFAIELARLLSEEAEGGTVFVPLAPLRDEQLVLTTIAERLGTSSDDPAAIAAHLRERRTHVIVDNVEHLLPGAAGTLAELAARAPTLRLLITSREALRVHGEELLDLPPLAEDEAVALFLGRARAILPELEETPAVDELCRRLDRLPLAIELAAARTRLLAPEALLERLGARLDLLSGTRDADPRHATLRATIAWSHDLLDAGERRLFAGLAVFAAGCTLESAEAVCDAELDVLESLLDKSLVRRRTGTQGEERLWMLETIREFAVECLDESVEAETTRRRLAERMLAIARSANLSDEAVVAGAQRHEHVLGELDDMRAALDWAADNDVLLGLELAVALEGHWAAHSPAEGARRLGELLTRAVDPPPALRAAALRVRGGTLYRSGDFEHGTEHHRASLEAFQDLGDERATASLRGRLVVHEAYFGALDRARRDASDLLVLSRELGLPRLECEALGAMATVCRRAEEYEEAWALAQLSAETAAACGWVWWHANLLTELLELGLELGRLDEAEAAGRDAVRLAGRIDDRLALLWTLAGLSVVAFRRGDLERAGAIWGSVETELELEPPPMEEGIRELAAPLAEVADDAFVSAVREGRLLGLESAVALALGEDQTLP
jgi:predicted ATPase/class 3 adenylate cyclase